MADPAFRNFFINVAVTADVQCKMTTEAVNIRFTRFLIFRFLHHQGCLPEKFNARTVVHRISDMIDRICKERFVIKQNIRSMQSDII